MMRLRAHANVVPIDEERERRRAVRFEFVNWQAEPSPPSHPAAQALLAGLLQGIGDEAATRALPRPQRPWWRRWLQGRG
jgi:hypothetical protein